MAGINILIQIFTSFMSCLIIKNISQLRCFADQMELIEEIKEKLIDKMKVYSDNRIEICWKFESVFFDTKTMHK